MAELIPIFPLELVLFPTEKLNLHIFESRYRQLVNDIDIQDIEFGIPFFQSGSEMSYGTMASLAQISKTYPDGEMDIKTVGSSVFRILNIHQSYQNKLYSGATVEILKNEHDSNAAQTELLSASVRNLYDLMKIDKPLPGFDHQFFSYKVGHHVGLSQNQELELLRLRSEKERQEFLITHLENLMPIVMEMEDLRKKVEMNGHFKDLQPPDFT